MKKIVLIVVVVLITISAQSFNCNNASTAIEESICADSVLGELDETVAAEYRFGKSVFGKAHSAGFIDEQRRWIDERNTQCGNGNVAPLVKLYSQRITDISKAVSDDLMWYSGEYEITHTIRMYNPDSQQYESDVTSDLFRFNWLDTKRVEFTIQTVYTNAHMCDLEGVAIRNNSNSFIWSEELADGTLYEIEIFFTSDGWFSFRLLPGTDGSYGCGLNASIYSAQFKRVGDRFMGKVLK